MWKRLSAVRKSIVVATASASTMLVAPLPVTAMDINFGDDSELSGNLGVTLGYATSFRAQDKDPDVNALGANELSELRVPEKGDKISDVMSLALDFGLDWRNYGMKVSGKYQYDAEIMGGDSIDPLSTYGLTGVPAVTGSPGPWSAAAEDYSGDFTELKDAFVYGAFDIGETALEVRAGKQVINWGEGLYFLDGVSVQAPLNFNQLVTPGSELKDAYIGNTSLYVQMGMGESTSVEAYAHSDWNRTELPPQGTFYGYDWFGRGGDEPVDGIADANGMTGDPDFGYRDADVEADDGGQWGLSARTSLGDAEYGLYYSRYHETLPFFVSTGVLDGVEPCYSAFCTSQIWPEDIEMFGASFSTTAGDFALAGEVAYRADRPLMNAYAGIGAYAAPNGSTSIVERDTANASVNAIWLGGQGALGIDSQVALVQFGVDHISGDTSSLTPMSAVTRDKYDHTLPTSRSADDIAYGVAMQWIGTWQSLWSNVDLSLDLYLQHDIEGVSHFYGNFAEDRTLFATALTAAMGSEFEASLSYSQTEHDESDYEDLDTLSFAMNYKF